MSIDRREPLADDVVIDILLETQEMIDFCAEHDIELITIDQINEAYERMLKSDVRYRFVIDMQSLKG
jgi:alcohol dehydrogenase (NADP+)